MPDELQKYRGGETTGFQSPTQDHIEHVIDLARILNLGHAGFIQSACRDRPSRSGAFVTAIF